MTLWTEVSNMREVIKHSPEQVDLIEVMSLLGRVEDALEVLVSLTAGADISLYSHADGSGWAVGINISLDDRRPLLKWLADG